MDRAAGPSRPTMSATARAFLPTDSDSVTWILAEDGQDDAGHAPAGSYVQDLLALSQNGENAAIDEVAADEFFVIRVPRQVELLVPLPEQAAILVQPGDLRLGQDDFMAPKRGGQRVFHENILGRSTGIIDNKKKTSHRKDAGGSQRMKPLVHVLRVPLRPLR